MSHLIAITGGIGTGKSVVSHILRVKGYNVYDCDTAAKLIMDNDTAIHQRLTEQIHPEAVKNGKINRTLIADIVFSDNEKLKTLNAITHTAVLEDIRLKAKAHHPYGIMFIETAILYQSNLDLIVDKVWNVTAPSDLRIDRVMKRNSCDRETVTKRITAQDAYIPSRCHPMVYTIVNDNVHPLLTQIHNLLENL